MDRLSPGHVQEDSTFFIDQDYTVEYLFGVQFLQGATSGEVTVPDNVTFIFTGGKITSSIPCNIIGSNTKVLAPITQIFGDNITATGSWVIDRAYPQWFGYTPESKKVEYQFDDQGNSQNDADVADGGAAIQKAINMKVNGEVFLPHGFYVLKTPILMPLGISLVGEMGQGAESNNPDIFFQGTVLQSWKLDNTQQTTDDSNEYMLYFNSDTSFTRLHGEGSGFKAGQISEIRNLTFFNYICSISMSGTNEEIALRLKKETSSCIKGIYAADAISVENVRFEYIRQAVVFANSYVDSKRIVNCAVYTDYEERFQYLSSDIYAFEMRFLGDNLLFEHNAVNGKYHKGLRVDHCFGGNVSCNIINADCLIVNSKGLTFSGNHIEGGKQIEVICSNVTFEGNFYEKRFKPSIRIRGNRWHHKSVITLINESFLFYENSRLVNTQEYLDTLAAMEDPSGSIPDEFSSLDDYKAFLALKSVSENVSEYDIDIDRDSEVILSNVFRYRITAGSASDMHFTGIAMRKVTYQYNDAAEVTSESYENFAGFNDYSYMLSKQGQVTSGFHVAKHFAIDGLAETITVSPMNNNTITWMAESGYCEYRFQMVFDKQRPLVATYNGSQLLSDSGFPENQDGSRTMGQTGGVFLAIKAESELNGNHKILRLYRYIKDENDSVICRHYVEIPLSGTRSLYDNGISINGYKWKSFTGTATGHSLKGDLGLQSIVFEGSHVRCRTTTAESNLSSRTQWLKGDELINMNYNPNDQDPDNDWTIKVIQ